MNPSRTPFRRTVGGRLQLEFDYKGDIETGAGDDARAFKCVVTAQFVDDWSSLGSWITYETQRTLDYDDNTQQYYDRWQRGIQIDFKVKGYITKTDYQTIFNAIVGGLALFNLVPTIMLLLAKKMCGEKSKLYEAAIVKPLSYGNELAKFAANAAMIITMFKLWDADAQQQKSPDAAAADDGDAAVGDGGIDAAELASVFAHSFSKEDSLLMAKFIVAQGSEDGDKTLNPKELIDVMSDELVSMDAVLKFISKKKEKMLSTKSAKDLLHQLDQAEGLDDAEQGQQDHVELAPVADAAPTPGDDPAQPPAGQTGQPSQRTVDAFNELCGDKPRTAEGDNGGGARVAQRFEIAELDVKKKIRPALVECGLALEVTFEPAADEPAGDDAPLAGAGLEMIHIPAETLASPEAEL